MAKHLDLRPQEVHVSRRTCGGAADQRDGASIRALRCGGRTVARTIWRSGWGETGRRVSRWRIAGRTVAICSSASAWPRQRRPPPPKGTNATGGGAGGKRAGGDAAGAAEKRRTRGAGGGGGGGPAPA